MREREPGFFYGLGAGDFLRIGFAFLFSLAGFYLMWRMLFGPPLFGPEFQSEIRVLQSGSQNPAAQSRPAPPKEAQPPGEDATPGEVSVGIAPAQPNGTRH